RSLASPSPPTLGAPPPRPRRSGWQRSRKVRGFGPWKVLSSRFSVLSFLVVRDQWSVSQMGDRKAKIASVGNSAGCTKSGRARVPLVPKRSPSKRRLPAAGERASAAKAAVLSSKLWHDWKSCPSRLFARVKGPREWVPCLRAKGKGDGPSPI